MDHPRYYEPPRRPFVDQRVIPRRKGTRAHSGYHSDEEVIETSSFRDWHDDSRESTFDISLRIPKYVRGSSYSGRPPLHTPRPSYTKDSSGLLLPQEHVRSRSALGRRFEKDDYGSDDDFGRPRNYPKLINPVVPGRGRASISHPEPRRDKGYPYVPLRPKEFRLVEILPATMTAIRCKIFHAPQDDPPPYIALSYAWGDLSDKKDIVVDSHTVSITASLHGAFNAVRRKNEAVLVWADALCINQQDDAEKSRQVPLMATIYTAAASVAIWLGPEDDDSSLAMDLLRGIAERADNPETISRAIFSEARRRDFEAAGALFERGYWHRLWIVQEVLNARSVTVHCGRSKLPWSVFTRASATFRRHKDDLIDSFGPVGLRKYTMAQVLTQEGPAGLEMDVSSLHETIIACRSKLASDGRDKVYGLLGILSTDLRHDIPIDYSLPIKDVYTNVVDHIITTTERLDIICDANHYPIIHNAITLPTWVPDYSHYHGISRIGRLVKSGFSAARSSKARAEILDDHGRRNKLHISAVQLDTIAIRGMTVNSVRSLDDYVMAFLQWRSHVLETFGVRDKIELELVQQDFASTLLLGQLPKRWKRPRDWLTVCYHAFASQIRESLPYLPLDRELEAFADTDVGIDGPECERIVDEVGRMFYERSFFITENGLMGLGTGFMSTGDIVVVPLGCSTPILLRPEGMRDEYRFVGDVYIHGYMYGRAIDELDDGRRELVKYVIH